MTLYLLGHAKIYQTGTVALDDLTLTIEPGMSFGLMGENGAGKSTLVKLLMGFIFPTKGQLGVLGETEVRRAHARIGYLHETRFRINGSSVFANLNQIDLHPFSCMDCYCPLFYQSTLSHYSTSSECIR